MVERFELEQGTQEWLDWRRSGITATEAACAKGVSKWGTPLSVYEDKLNPKPHEVSEYEEWGSLLEDVIKFKKFAKMHPEFEVRQGACYANDWRKCSLDGELWKDGKCVAILEIKTGSDVSAWDPVPEYYYAQVQWQMHVTGINTVYFAVLIHGHHYLERVVNYDPVYCDALEKACYNLWTCILNKTPPEATTADIDMEVVAAAATNNDNAGSHELSDEEYAAYLILKDKSAEFEKKLKAQKLAFMQYLTNAKYLTHGGMRVGQMVVMKARESVDAAKLRADYPDVYEAVKRIGKPTSYLKIG